MFKIDITTLPLRRVFLLFAKGVIDKMADYTITIQATCNGFDKIEQQLNRILSKSGQTISLNVQSNALNQQMRQIQNTMSASGKTVGANFGKGVASGLAVSKAPAVKQATALNRAVQKESEKASKDTQKYYANLNNTLSQRTARQYAQQQRNVFDSLQNGQNRLQQRVIEAQAKAAEKIRKNASLGALDVATSDIKKQLNDLENIKPKRIKSIDNLRKQALSLQNEIKSGKSATTGNLLTDAEFIEKQNQFNDLIQKSKNGIKALKNEFSGLNKPVNRLDAITASNNTLKWLKNNTRAAKKYGEALNEVALMQRNATTKGELAKANREYRNITSQAALEGKTGKSMTQSVITDVKRLGSALSAFGVINRLVMDVPHQIYTAVSQVDSAITGLRMATGISRDEAVQLMDTYSEMGTKLKATSTDIAASSTEWMKQGKSISEAQKLTEDSIVLSKIGDLSSQDATKTITAAMKSYKLSESEVMNFVDQISAIDMASATDVGGLATAFNEVAANAKQAGISTQELLSYAAVIGETTQEGMSSVGTSLNAIFARMGNIKLSRLKDYETGEDLSNVETVLRGVGINLRDNQDEFRDFGEVLDETAGRWTQFSGVQQRAISQAFAGTHHMNEFMILMQNYDKAMEYVDIANNSSGESLEKYSAYTESLDGKMQDFKNSFQTFSTSVASSDFLGNIIEGGGEALNVVSSLIDQFGMLTVLGGGYGLFKTSKGEGKLYCCYRKRALVA